MVTKLSGLNPFGIDGNSLASVCQKKYLLVIFLIVFVYAINESKFLARFACSASYAASPSRVNTMEITIQVETYLSPKCFLE